MIDLFLFLSLLLGIEVGTVPILVTASPVSGSATVGEPSIAIQDLLADPEMCLVSLDAMKIGTLTLTAALNLATFDPRAHYRGLLDPDARVHTISTRALLVTTEGIETIWALLSCWTACSRTGMPPLRKIPATRPPPGVLSAVGMLMSGMPSPVVSSKDESPKLVTPKPEAVLELRPVSSMPTISTPSWKLSVRVRLISVASMIGIETTSFIAILGAAGLAIGLALQGSLGNFAGGVLVLLFKPFKVGDFIDAQGVAGTVSEIQIFNTIIKTPDNKVIIVPNGAVYNGVITNFSKEATRRVDFVFGIGYGDDIKKAKEVIARLVDADERAMKDPAPTIVVSELADSSVNISCRVWVNASDYWGVFFDLTENVKLTFDAEGISIPFPQQDVHMHQA